MSQRTRVQMAALLLRHRPPTPWQARGQPTAARGAALIGTRATSRARCSAFSSSSTCPSFSTQRPCSPWGRSLRALDPSTAAHPQPHVRAPRVASALRGPAGFHSTAGVCQASRGDHDEPHQTYTDARGPDVSDAFDADAEGDPKSDAEYHRMVDDILRVDHAGEYAAVRIYQGQLDVLRGTPEHALIAEMKVTEDEHLEGMNHLVAQRRARPTALLPIVHVVGYALGAGTAMLGKEAAMACTVAVEEVIGEHYNDQIRTLLEAGKGDDPLVQTLKKNRDEELEHLQTGLDNNAKLAPGYEILSNVIKAGCKLAIEVAKKV